MNEERLYINGQEVKLKVSSPLAYTLQVNDISGVANRQASFTRTISIPKCPENNLIMGYLGVAGNQSISPYIKNKINYYVGNDCVIYEGWGIVSETSEDDYKLNIYDGVIDLYKTIENKTLNELDLSEINHDKSLSGVTYTWDNDLNYKYILADYNGKAKYSGDTINIDYLVPSVKVSYLWDKIFSNYGMTFEGSVFSTEDFTNLWMTYPKGVTTLQPETDFYSTTSIAVRSIQAYPPEFSSTSLFIYVGGSAGNFESIVNQQHFKVYQGGDYRIKITGKVKPKTPYGGTTPVDCKIIIAKDQEGTGGLYGNTIVEDDVLVPSIGGTGNFEAVNINYIVTLNDHQSFCLLFRANSGLLNVVSEDPSDPLKIEISRVYSSAIDFNEALNQFKITDFLKEILWRYSLTIFKDKYTNNYKFLTLDERIATAEKVDWSNKFQRVKSEKYIYGDYAQKNNIRHKYNDENSSYNDGSIFILNQNLNDEKNIIESKIYSPEKELNTTELPFESHIYKLWNKEINENEGVQEVKYKELDKRFYFLKSQEFTFSSPVVVGSEATIQSTSATTAPIESYSGVSYNEVVTNYYSQIGNIVSTANITTAEFNLTSTDIATFDFKKQYFIEQLGSYFLVNKINNWRPNDLCDVELIKVENDIPRPDLTPPVPEELYITITGVTFTNVNTWTRNINVHYITNVPDAYLKPEFVNNDTYTFPTLVNNSPYIFFDSINPLGGMTTLKITTLDGTVQSNTVSWWG